MATDGGSIFGALSELGGGVAIAMALGFSEMGVVGRNVFGSGERLAVSGAIGFSVEENSYGRRGSNSLVGGRAGAQLTW